MQNKYFRMGWLPLSLRSYNRYPSINSLKFVMGDNIFYVTKGKSKDYYTLLVREKAKLPNIIQKLQSNFHFNRDHLKQIFKLPHSIVVESYVKAFQYKVINSIRNQFWIECELYWCLILNQRIRLCLENVFFRILTENACPLLQLLNYFILIGKQFLWDRRSKQILPNIYGFRAEISAKYETKKISNKDFFK